MTRAITPRHSIERCRWPDTDKVATLKEAARARGKRLGLGIGSYVDHRRCRTLAPDGPRRTDRQHLGERDRTRPSDGRRHGHHRLPAARPGTGHHVLPDHRAGARRRHGARRGHSFGQPRRALRTGKLWQPNVQRRGGRDLPGGAGDQAEGDQGRRAHAAGEAEEDVVFEDGTGAGQGRIRRRAKPLQEIASALWFAWDLPPGVEPGLEATSYFNPADFNFPFGTHVAIVEDRRADGSRRHRPLHRRGRRRHGRQSDDRRGADARQHRVRHGTRA